MLLNLEDANEARQFKQAWEELYAEEKALQSERECLMDKLQNLDSDGEAEQVNAITDRLVDISRRQLQLLDREAVVCAKLKHSGVSTR